MKHSIDGREEGDAVHARVSISHFADVQDLGRPGVWRVPVFCKNISVTRVGPRFDGISRLKLVAVVLVVAGKLYGWLVVVTVQKVGDYS